MLKEASIFKQLDYSACFEWGYDGVEELAGHSDILVIIDVLSFTTCVDIVCGRGGVVYPYRTRDEIAAFFAQRQGALLAGKRGEPLSLSPSCLMTLPEGSKIVLPSPCCTTAAQAGSLPRGDLQRMSPLLLNGNTPRPCPCYAAISPTKPPVNSRFSLLVPA